MHVWNIINGVHDNFKSGNILSNSLGLIFKDTFAKRLYSYIIYKVFWHWTAFNVLYTGEFSIKYHNNLMRYFDVIF